MLSHSAGIGFTEGHVAYLKDNLNLQPYFGY